MALKHKQWNCFAFLGITYVGSFPGYARLSFWSK